MKKINKWIIIFLTFVVVYSCSKDDDNDNQSIIGKWIYEEDYSQTFDFQNSTKVLINGHEFIYEITGDTIEFSYNGPLLIAIIPTKHRFEIQSETDYLMIEDLDKLHFFTGKAGENMLLRGIEPNNFIGYWVNIELNDTLIFLTNIKLERPHGYYNDWYEYSYTTDSITIQYSGPDELLLPPIKYGYDFTGDTLIINFHQTYYPKITTGIKSYLKRY